MNTSCHPATDANRVGASAPSHSVSLPSTISGVPAELIDRIDVPLWIKDAAHRYVYANQSYAALLGVASTDLLGQRDEDVMSSEAALASLSRDMLALNQDDAHVAQALLQTDGGEPVAGQVTLRRLLVGGHASGTFGWFAPSAKAAPRDNWEIREQQLLFHFSQAAHEVRSPLAGLVGLVQLLLEDPWLTMKQQRYLTAMDHCGRHLLDVVNDMIDLSRAGAGKIRLAVEKVDLAQLFEEVAEWVRPRLDARRVEFRIATPGLQAADESPRHFMLDSLRLKQVLLNLLSNAVRLTEAGTVELRFETRQPAAATDSGGEAKRTRLRFEVSDTGVGMTTEQVSRLFSYEHRFGTEQGKPRGSGSGLGLLISRRLCRAMGGDLYVSSAPGQGSSFWFEMDVPMHPC